MQKAIDISRSSLDMIRSIYGLACSNLGSIGNCFLLIVVLDFWKQKARHAGSS